MTTNNNDQYDGLIARSIESVAGKREQMARWEEALKQSALNKAMAKRRKRIYWISAAACVAVICGVGLSIIRPGGQIGRENEVGGYNTGIGMMSETGQPEYRGSISDDRIDALIEAGQFDRALEAIDMAMADTVVDPGLAPDRMEYERALIAERQDYLTWTKINVLVKKGDKTEAVKLLREFVKTDSQYSRQAEELLDSITE